MCVNYLGDPLCHEVSTNTVYFQDFGMTKVRIFLPVSMTCLYNSPLM